MQAKDKAILILSFSCLALLLTSICFFSKWRASVSIQQQDKSASDQLLLTRSQDYKASVDSINRNYNKKIIAQRDSFNNVTIPSIPTAPKTSHGISGNSAKAANVLTDYFSGH